MNKRTIILGCIIFLLGTNYAWYRTGKRVADHWWQMRWSKSCCGWMTQDSYGNQWVITCGKADK